MLRDYVLLITGCIDPNPDVPFLEIKNAENRRRQYIESFEYYIKKTSIRKIVYCDNSMALKEDAISKLANQYSKEFEWLSFMGDNVKAVAQGKGYGEGEIIEFALKHSRLLQNAKYFIKVTGRVIIRNIDILIPFMNMKKMYFCRNTSTNIDTKLYGLPTEIYKKAFLTLYRDVDDKKGKYLENLFSEQILGQHLVVHNFIVFPDAQGVSGSTGKSYSLPLKTRIKLTIKSYFKE